MNKKQLLRRVLFAGFVICSPLAWGQTTVFDYTGSTQTFTVPDDVNQIQITTKGASGGQGGHTSSGTPGFGVSIQGNFEVDPGQVLTIMVGEEGEGAQYVGGGGGGSFVWDELSGELLSAAGGGGGGGSTDGSDTYVNGVDASIEADGTNGSGFDTGAGTSGNGGIVPTATYWAAGGAGWNSDGSNGSTHGCDYNSIGGERPLDGGAGGSGGGSITSSADGGYGGGGGGNARCGAVGGGGGGGYSGGGAGGELIVGDFNGGGGGGSFNAGSFPVELVLGTTGNGEVIISVLCYVMELETEIVHESMGGDGAINLTVTGGTSPYTYDWDNDGTGDFDDSEDLVALSFGYYTVVVKDDAGCTATMGALVADHVSVEENDKATLMIYPNPTSNLLNIQYEGVYDYELMSLNGAVIFSGQAADNHELSLTDQAKGVYLLKISSDNHTEIIKVVKE